MSVSQVALDNQLNATLLHRWIREARASNCVPPRLVVGPAGRFDICTLAPSGTSLTPRGSDDPAFHSGQTGGHLRCTVAAAGGCAQSLVAGTAGAASGRDPGGHAGTGQEEGSPGLLQHAVRRRQGHGLRLRAQPGGQTRPRLPW